MHKNVYDVDHVLKLYDKYGSMNAVALRTGYGAGTVKRILLENGVELKKYVPPRWDFKKKFVNQI